MKTISTIKELRGIASRTIEYRDSHRAADALRQISDAATADPWGRAVQVDVTTDPAECPADCAGEP